jgi:hypothetical protein
MLFLFIPIVNETTAKYLFTPEEIPSSILYPYTSGIFA